MLKYMNMKQLDFILNKMKLGKIQSFKISGIIFDKIRDDKLYKEVYNTIPYKKYIAENVWSKIYTAININTNQLFN